MSVCVSESPPRRLASDSDWKPSTTNVPLRSRTLGSLLSGSGYDFSALDIEEENYDENSPRGVLEASSKNVELEAGSRTNGPTHCIPKRRIFCWRKKLRKFSSKIGGVGNDDVAASSVDDKMWKMKASRKIFSFCELRKATNNFSPENLIGRGGFADVYKGCLKGGELVAIKRLIRGPNEERISSFLSELGIIAHVDHPNTAKLIGYGVQKGLHIVLQLSSLGSLGSLLHDSSDHINWSIRYKIALGIADGLLYLHEGCQRRIIHRDIKADNILLTENYEPQICDFGLGKWLPRQCTHHNVLKFEGTFGYFAPEYFMHGIVDEKTDVYAFGVLLVELISGRKAFNGESESILIWAKPLLDTHELEKLVDPVLEDDYDEEELDRMVLTAALCVQQAPVLRPRMNQAVILLRGDDYSTDNVKAKESQALQRAYSEKLQDAKEHSSTNQLNELQRHSQVAFDL